MSKRYHFIQADVFTPEPFGGNQLAVFTDARGLSDEEMQTLTREQMRRASNDITALAIGGQTVIVGEGDLFWD